jgi:hypothetical protein
VEERGHGIGLSTIVNHAELRSARTHGVRRSAFGTCHSAFGNGSRIIHLQVKEGILTPDIYVVYFAHLPWDRVPMTATDTVRTLLDRLPDDCSIDDVLYHLYVVQTVREGVADAEAGRVIPHERVAADLRRKWLLGSAQ